MKYLLLALVLVNATTSAFCYLILKENKILHYKHVGIIHQYLFKMAEDLCKNNEGLHFIVDNSEITINNDMYPCAEKYIASCEDGTKKLLDTGVRYCFISESQLKDTL